MQPFHQEASGALIIFMFSELRDHCFHTVRQDINLSKPRNFCLENTSEEIYISARVSLGNRNIFCHANVLFDMSHNPFYFIT